MISKYFIGGKRNIFGNHVMHKEGCPFLSDNDKMINHGMFESPHEAINDGKQLYNKVETCLFCCKEFYDLKRKIDIPNMFEKRRIRLYEEIKITWESALKCSVN